MMFSKQFTSNVLHVVWKRKPGKNTASWTFGLDLIQLFFMAKFYIISNYNSDLPCW